MNISKTLLVITMTAALAACNDDALSGPGYTCDVTNPVSSLRLSPAQSAVLVHSPALASDTVQVRGTAFNRLGAARTDVPIRYKSSDTTIATVDTLGVVSAKQPGTVKITASSCGESASATINIVASVLRVVVTPVTDTVIAGDTASAVARAYGPDGVQVSNVKFTFTASNPSLKVIQTSDSTARFATSTAGTATLSARGEGVTGTSSLLVLARGFLLGSASASSTTSSLDAGDALTCGLITLGRGYCWGLNNHGQVGAQSDSTCFLGTDAGAVVNDSVKTTALPCTLLPLRISDGLNFTTVSAGDSTGCAVTIQGRSYCWGKGTHGEIGNGGTADKAVPTLVTGALTFTAISVGGSHACALATGGVAYCWGDDTYGQLGDSRRVNSTTPIPVSGGGGPAAFASISAGFRHSCAVATNGVGYCWGRNNLGQLGNGVGGDQDTPVQVAGGLSFASISAGGDHTCGVTTAGAAYCWGSNIDGQGGRGTAGDFSFVPVAVSGGLTFSRLSASTGTRAVTPINVRYKLDGSGHTCGLTAGGSIYCWGDDADLQLGRGPFSGSNGISATPVQVAQGERPAGVTFTSVSVGSRHSCGVGSDGSAYCWGSNVMGALGNTLQAALRGLPQRVATPQ